MFSSTWIKKVSSLKYKMWALWIYLAYWKTYRSFFMRKGRTRAPRSLEKTTPSSVPTPTFLVVKGMPHLIILFLERVLLSHLTSLFFSPTLHHLTHSTWCLSSQGSPMQCPLSRKHFTVWKTALPTDSQGYFSEFNKSLSFLSITMYWGSTMWQALIIQR